MNTPTSTRQQPQLPAGATATVPIETLLMCRQGMLTAYSTVIGQIDRSLVASGLTPVQINNWSGDLLTPALSVQPTRPATQVTERQSGAAQPAAANEQPKRATAAKKTPEKSPINPYITEAINATPGGCNRVQIAQYIRAHHPDYKFEDHILSMNLKRQWTGKQIQAFGQVSGKGANPTYYPLSVTVQGASMGPGFKTKSA
jgi:hypothetical protein